MDGPPDYGVQRARRGQLIGVLFVVIVIAIAVVAGSGALGGSNPTEGASVVNGVKGTKETTALLRGIPQRGIVLGAADAPATIVEFIDVKCSACQQFILTDGKKVISRLVRTGKANLEVRVIGLPMFKPDNLLGRNAVNSLAETNQAFAFIELLYYNQKDESTNWVSLSALQRIARQSQQLRGVPITIQASDAVRRVNAETDALAKSLDVQGTPTIFVRPRGRRQVADYKKVGLNGTGSRAGKIASAVEKVSGGR